jgi:hypothetical protein
MVVGVLIAACALLQFSEPELNRFASVKLPLVMLGIFVFFSARQDLVADWSEDLFDDVSGYRVRSDGVDLLEPVELEEDGEEAVLVEHQRYHGEPHAERRQSQEAHEDDRVDDILARLHDAGISGLSAEEIAILQRASARYRQRLHSADDD